MTYDPYNWASKEWQNRPEKSIGRNRRPSNTLTITVAATALGVTRDAVWGMISRGELEAMRQQSPVLVKAKDVADLALARMVK